MAEINLSLQQFFEQAFGYKTQVFDPKFKDVRGNTALSRTDRGAHGSKYYATGDNGVEYYMPVTVRYTDAYDAIGLLPGGTGVLKEWDLPFPVVSVTCKKTIIETALTERRGTVKELINIEDYVIKIKGFIIGTTNEYPEGGVATMRSIFEQNASLRISCPLTDIFLLRPDRSGSDAVVVKGIAFPNLVGVKNVQPYEIELLSDEAFSLIID